MFCLFFVYFFFPGVNQIDLRAIFDPHLVLSDVLGDGIGGLRIGILYGLHSLGAQ